MMRRIGLLNFFAFAISGLLLISISANIYLSLAAEKYYLDLLLVRFYPLSLTTYEERALAKTDLPRLVFFGDSRSADWPFPKYDHVEFINRGIGGETSNQTMLRYDFHIASLEPDIVLVQTCINELKTIPLFPNRRGDILESCRQNIELIIEKTEQSGATLVITTVFPPGSPSLLRQPFWSADVSDSVNEINEFLMGQKAENVIVIDTHALLSDANGELDPIYSSDQLRINKAGYELLNRELVLILDNLVVEDEIATN